MANGYADAINDLREYNDLKTAVANLKDEIDEAERTMTEIKAVRYDSTPVQGGTSGYEDRMANYIDRRERLRIRLSTTESKIARIDRGLAGLLPNERLILKRFYVDNQGQRRDIQIMRLSDELGYESAQIYRIKDRALERFIRAMWGVVDA